MNVRSQRRGLTRTDLISVLIIGVLMGTLAVPGIGALRAGSHVMQCVANLRQLSLAAANHEAAMRRFPLVSSSSGALTDVAPSAVGDEPVDTAGYSFHAKLLPFMEERILYDELRWRSKKLMQPPFDEQLLRADDKTHFASVKIPALTCPEVERDMVELEFAAMVNGKRANVKTEYAAWAEKVAPPALASYVGISGTHFDDNDGLLENGVMVSSCTEKDAAGNCIGKGLRLRNIGDGLSKTVMFCESRETAYAAWIDGQAMWVVGLDSTGKIGAGEREFITAERSLLNAGPNLDKMEISPTYSDLGLNQSKAWPGAAPRRFGPSSRHANGAINHAFGDAHVLSISAEIDPTVYARLITRNAGDPVDSDDILLAAAGVKIDGGKVPMDLRGTIDKAIGLIEKQDIEGTLTTLMPADKVRQITANGKLAEMAASFLQRKKDQVLLQALKATGSPETEVRADGDEYLFKFKVPISGQSSMRFGKVDGRWYLRN